MGAAAAAVGALALLIRTRASGSDDVGMSRKVPESSQPDIGSNVESGEAPRELLAAWVQFLKKDLSEAVNALNNRLNVIAAQVAVDDPTNLSEEQRQRLEQVRIEVGRAVKITSTLMRRVTAVAPSTIPRVVREYDGSSFEPARVLLVENDDANRAVITKLLERLGQHVTPVVNGYDAYEVLKQGEVDCIISDVRMPVVGGRTLFEQVEETLPHLAGRFVFVTGDYTNPESRAFLEQTGQPFVGKPYEVEALLGAVAEILKKTRRQDS